jgi:arabinan endo-1,5-alpha-L-arabinosidase
MIRAPILTRENLTMLSRPLAASVVLLLCTAPSRAQNPRSAGPHAFQLSGDAQGTHDPSIIKAGNTWYVFSTTAGRGADGQLPIRCSSDLENWKRCGNVFPAIPDWIKQDSPKTTSLWAPDISYFDGVYHLYYVYSIFGKNTSGIALMTNKTLDSASPDFHWVDQGLVLGSKADDNFNAIDPNLTLDAKGVAWLVFGSFWDGIKMRRLDRATGKLSTTDSTLYSLARRSPPGTTELTGALAPPPFASSAATLPASPPAGGRGAAAASQPPNPHAIEAPFVVHRGRYYYLFVSFDACCRGARSTYRTMVGRSHKITGPYVDASGKPMLEGGGTQLLAGNSTWVGPGGESVLLQPGEDIIVFHAYDAKTGAPSLQISSIAWVKGWPKVTIEGGP